MDKPAGPTSFEVVARVRRALRARKAGHAGTLDPAATGVLVVCLEDAVRLQQYLADADKAYRATVAFGAATDTEDAEGRVVAEGDASGLSEEAVRAALPAFVGQIAQRPPMFSAVRIGGRRLHEAARAGEEVPRPARLVRVESLELLELGAFGEGRRNAVLSVRCGKGTYVRTLAADLGRALGVPAHLTALRRTAASGFTLDEALSLEALESLVRAGGPEAVRPRVVPPALALRPLPEVRVSPGEALDLAHGRSIASAVPDAGPPAREDSLARAVDGALRLVAVCRLSKDGRLHPVRVFMSAAELAGPVST